MTAATDRTLRGAFAGGAERPTTIPDDQLYMQKLCLELQLEAFLLALGASAVASRSAHPQQRAAALDGPDGLPWGKWLAEDLERTFVLTRDCVEASIPLPSSMGLVANQDPDGVVESLAARYSAIATVVGEMLDRTDPRVHASTVSRLYETRTHCEERLDALIGQTPDAAAQRFFTPTKPGHYLG